MKKIKALVVENILAIRNHIKHCIEGNFNVMTISECTNGDAAKSLLENERFDLIVCGQDIPGLKGDELLFWLRNHPDLSSTPFIIILPRNDKKLISQVLKRGVNGYVVTPFTCNDLLKKISVIIDSYDRRAHKRFKLKGKIILNTNAITYTGRLKDISAGGLLGVFDRNEGYPELLQEVHCRFELESGHELAGITGFVIRLQPEELSLKAQSILTAIKFLNIDKDMEEEITRMINQ